MWSEDPRDWFTVMAAFPCGMLQTAVSYPVSESFMVLTQLVLPGVSYWSQNPLSLSIFCLCLSTCKLLILLPCTPLLAHEFIPSLVPLVPLREIHRAQLLSLVERWQYLSFSPDSSLSVSGLCSALPMCKFRTL